MDSRVQCEICGENQKVKEVDSFLSPGLNNPSTFPCLPDGNGNGGVAEPWIPLTSAGSRSQDTALAADTVNGFPICLTDEYELLGNGDGDSIEMALSRADIKMYEDKRCQKARYGEPLR